MMSFVHRYICTTRKNITASLVVNPLKKKAITKIQGSLFSSLSYLSSSFSWHSDPLEPHSQPESSLPLVQLPLHPSWFSQSSSQMHLSQSSEWESSLILPAVLVS